MEKLKVKHDHTLTDIIKVGIFAIFLLLPLFVFAPTAFYYGFNEHAKNETTTQVDIQYKYETNEVNSVDDLIVGNVYHANQLSFYSNNDDVDISLIFLKYQSINVIDYDYFPLIEGELEDYSFTSSFKPNVVISYELTGNNLDGNFYITNNNEFYLLSSFERLQIQFRNVDFIVSYNVGGFQSIFEENLLTDNTMVITSSTFNVIESVDVQTDVSQSITQQMYNSWQQVWESSLFNWTGNNNFAFTINAMSSVFGISQNSYIANYINYLLTLTAIYVIFDIVIAVFVKLTHMFHE